eukprot:SM000141S00840  [mRNA]  locus=s141:47509:49553:+ [translate_table: standard]
MLASFSFEVHGKVQNMLFRKAAVEKARTMGLVGFCENTGHGTVRGEVQGGARALEEMKNWLANVGSPKSRIDRCVITNEVVGLAKPAYTTFEIIRRNQQHRLQSNPTSPSISSTSIMPTTIDIREGQIVQHILLRRELSEACQRKISNRVGNWADMQPLCCFAGLHDVSQLHMMRRH